jgi:O-antigen/teichoic acid export membrane protein
MSIVRSIITNTAARFTAELVSRLGAAAFWIVVARHLGASGLGSLAFALSLFSLFETISTLGLGAVITRDVARDHTTAARYFGHGMLLGLASSLVCGALMIGIAGLLRPSKDTFLAVTIMALSILPASGFYWSRAILWSAEKMSYIAIARVAENVFKVTAGLLALIFGMGLPEIAAILAASKVVSFAVCYAYARIKVTPPDWRIHLETIKYLLRQTPSFSLIAVFNSLFWSISVILLTKLAGETEAGIFSAAYKLVDIWLSFAFAYGQALFPIASRTSAENPQLFERLCKKSMKYVSLLTLAVAVGTNLLAHKLIPLFYGNEMIEAVPILRLLIWILVPFAIVPILAYSLMSHSLQRFDLAANVVATTAVTAASFALIPSLGAQGAAAALLVGCTTFFLIEFYSVEKTLFQIKLSWKNINPLIGIILMSLAVLVLRDKNILLAALVGGMIYIFFLWQTKTISKSEIRLMACESKA